MKYNDVLYFYLLIIFNHIEKNINHDYNEFFYHYI